MVNFFIHRPVFATVCSLLIVLAGAVAIPTLPVAQFPNLSPPTVNVNSAYIGANSQSVETSVTTPLERAINGAEGMRYITSNSANDGSSGISAVFDLTRDLDIAAVDVNNRVSTVLGRLPGSVQQTGVTVTKNSGSFVMAIGFYAEDNRYTPLFISNYLDIYVSDALKRVKGVGNIIIFGERKYAMRIWLDPTKLAQRGLTADDVVNALRAQNIEVAAGQVGQPPASANQQYQISVRAVGRLTTPEQFDAVVVKRAQSGAIVQLRDVGYAELGAENYGSKLRFNGYPAMGLGVQQLSTANALDVAKGVNDELAVLQKTFPPGLKYQVAFDNTTAVQESIKEVLKTLTEAIIIVILVIFIFLQTTRSTLIPAITIPVALVGTFIFVKLFGFSINTLTLFGITLATGLVVDDAIVVIENVERHIQEGEHDSVKATRHAMAEVTSAVVATSLVLIAVFVPVGLFPGTTGRMYQQFALTIAFSIALSAFNALTLSPALAALFLKKEHRDPNVVFRAFNRMLGRVTTWYINTLPHLERARYFVLVVFLAVLGATYWVYTRVPRSFVPEEDVGYFIIVVQAPEGASLEYTANVADRAAGILTQNKNIIAVFSVPGFSFSGAAPNRGMIFARLKDISQRPAPGDSEQAVINSLRGPLSSIREAFVVPFMPPAIQGLSQFGGFQFELQQTGTGSLEDMETTMRKFMGQAARQPAIQPQSLFATYSARTPQFMIDIDREKAESLGVSFSDIADALQVFMGSIYVNDFDYNARAYRVYVQAQQQFRGSPRDLREFYVRAATGQMIPLDNLVKVTQTTTASVISHYDLFRSAEIDGSAAPGYSSGQALDAMETAAKALPAGYTYSWTGMSLEERQSGSTTALLFGLGLLVVYLTLSAQYESFVLPFIILLSVPLAVLGALSAQWMRGLQNDVYCQVGLVMLIGLASKNAILIVEFAEQLQHKGLPLLEAAVEAARLRLRPILMTSVAFILGVLPLVFATGAGAAGRHSVGTTVFGGMIVSTALNLFIIPILYVLVRGMLPMKKEEIEGGEQTA